MKSPWSLIGWILAALLALAASLILYFMGIGLGWYPWLAPLLLWAALALVGFIQLLIWLIFKPRRLRVKPIDLSNPFSVQWEILKSSLNDGPWDLYLVAGDNDNHTASFLKQSLKETEYQSAPSNPGEISFMAANGRVWLKIPAGLWSAEQGSYDNLSNISCGNWGHLVKLLPDFPGTLKGFLVLMDPLKLVADPELQGRNIAIKFKSLEQLPTPPIPWWLIIHPLENLCSGNRFEQALQNCPIAEADKYDHPLGVFLLEQGHTKQTFSKIMGQGQSDLVEYLNTYLTKVDRGAVLPKLAAPVFSLMRELEQLPLILFASAFDTLKIKLECAGIFLALKSTQGPGQFSHLLLRHLVPEYKRQKNSASLRRTSWVINGLALGVFVAVGTWLGWGYLKGRDALNLTATSFLLLEQIKQQPLAPPPIKYLEIATDLSFEIEAKAHGSAQSFGAPQRADAQVKAKLSQQLSRYLFESPTQRSTLVSALSTWVEPSSSPLVFPTPQIEITIPGYATLKGRTQVAELVRQWDVVSKQQYSSITQQVLKDYDLKVYQSWSQNADKISQSLTDTKVEPMVSAGLIHGFAGVDFLLNAGRELNFSSFAQAPSWVLASGKLSVIDSLRGDEPVVDNLDKISFFISNFRHKSTNDEPQSLEEFVEATNYWLSYNSAAVTLASHAENPLNLVVMAEEMFVGKPSPPERVSVERLRQLHEEFSAKLDMHLPKIDNYDSKLYQTLLLSPVVWIAQASVSAAAISLQQQWNRKILLPTKNLSEAEKVALLLGEGGALAAFLSGPAQPYLVASRKGYQPAEYLGKRFPWSKEFINFINASQQGWKKAASSDGLLKVTALLHPVWAEGAQVISHPLGVDFRLVCEEDIFEAKTFNQPVIFQAQWSPELCGALKVTINFRDFTLHKIYDQQDGFIRFVKESVKGQLRFSAEDFPDQGHLLKASGAEFIVLGIDVVKGEKILKALTAPPQILKPPARIITKDIYNDTPPIK